MASSRYSITDDGIYLTPHDKIVEALKQKKNKSSHAEQESQHGFKTYDSTISNVSYINIEDGCVLQDKTTLQSQPNEDGIYLIPQDKLDEALKRKKNESSHVEQEEERGYKVYSSSESTTSNDSNVPEIEEVYVLQDTTAAKSQPKGSSRQKRKTEVEDLYDEDHYSLANTKNCVTKRAGVLEGVSKNEHRTTEPKEKKKFVTKKNLIIVGLVIVLFCLGGISGILITMFAGIISSN